MDGVTHRDRLFGGVYYVKIEESNSKERYGTKPLSDLDLGTTICWALSHSSLGMLSQEVDLIEEGLTPNVLDNLQPSITVSAWTASRSDCGSEYIIHVSLLSTSGVRSKPVQSFKETRNVSSWGNNSWVKISHTFRNYGRGVRSIKFSHGGKCTKCWSGNYGPKLAVPSVRVDID